MALITTAEVKTRLGLSGTAYDARIGVAIASAEAYVRRYCGRDMATGFETGTWTQYVSGNGLGTVRLQEWPVASITSVKVRTSASTFGDALGSDEYYVDPNTDNRGDLHRTGADSHGWDEYPWASGVWPEGRSNIEVVYVGGYATIPADLKEACHVLVDGWMSSVGRDVVNDAQGNLGVVNKVLKTEAERAATVRRLLEPWAHGGIA